MAPTVAPARQQPAPPPKVEEPAPPQPDPIDAQVARAEAEFQAGQANYTAGHLDAAKADFDRAVNLLLAGPVDVRTDERLQREFDKITEAIQNLEMQALQQGDGFHEQQAQPAPIDEANDVTFPVDPNIRAKAEAEMGQTRSDLPLVINDQVAGYIAFYSSSTRGRNTLVRAWVRAGRYREMIQRVFREEGVPQDLIYLAQAESGFQPLALSRAGARGMWQFIASRASGYGLERNWWVDERQDPEKSTRAAARHLKDLYNQFGDWYLAMAAYNSGPLTVQQGVQRTGYADFWELYKRNVLPRETKNYVPIIVAMTIIAKNPAQYGLADVQPDPPLDTDVVTVHYPVDLRLVAECVDVPLETLADLNPSLLRMTTPKDEDFALRLPAGTREKYQQAILAIPEDKRVWWRYHKVETGDTLASLASKYHIKAKAIAEANNLEGDELTPDAKLIIPVTGGKGDGELVYSKRPTRYRVRKGDTVLSVADDFGVPPDKLRQWNHLRGTELKKGRTLVIYRPVSGGSAPSQAGSKSKRGKKPPASANGAKRHTVKSGETLASIAATYNTTVEALRRDNPKAGDKLRVGQTLVIASGR
jgi:membrane-bound lytic murein transglycosylase D